MPLSALPSRGRHVLVKLHLYRFRKRKSTWKLCNLRMNPIFYGNALHVYVEVCGHIVHTRWHSRARLRDGSWCNGRRILNTILLKKALSLVCYMKFPDEVSTTPKQRGNYMRLFYLESDCARSIAWRRHGVHSEAVPGLSEEQARVPKHTPRCRPSRGLDQGGGARRWLFRQGVQGKRSRAAKQALVVCYRQYLLIWSFCWVYWRCMMRIHEIA